MSDAEPRTEQCPWAAGHEPHLWHDDERWCDGVARTGTRWDDDEEI